MDAKDIITKYVCPSLGTIMATAVFAGKIDSIHWIVNFDNDFLHYTSLIPHYSSSRLNRNLTNL